MKVRLLVPHVIDDVWRPARTVLDLPPGVAATPLMEGLDDEARDAIRRIKLRIFGPYSERRIDDPRPAPPFSSGGP